jgi:hypothetical protein
MVKTVVDILMVKDYTSLKVGIKFTTLAEINTDCIGKYIFTTSLTLPHFIVPVPSQDLVFVQQMY